MSSSEERIQTENQIKNIEQEIRDTQELTSRKHSIETLTDFYKSDKDENANFFLLGAKYLSTKYSHMRKVRGDGNCYYRAFLYALCESLINQKQKEPNMELDRLIQLAVSSLDDVAKYGYDKFALEMFHEEFVDLLSSLKKNEDAATLMNALHETLTQENGPSEYCTWYLRVLTAAHLKSDTERFQMFLENEYTDISTFCSREVEPMGKECGMLQCIALAESVGIHVNIEYLDGRPFNTEDGKGLAVHEFGNMDSTTKITLLYRPGHYDILYVN